MKGIFTLIIFSSFISPNKTFAYLPVEGNVTTLFGPYIFKTNFESSTSGANSQARTGLGSITLGDINPKGALEVGAFYLKKVFSRQENGKTQTEETQLLHITMGYRYWLNSTFSTSLSFFTSYAMGDPAVLHSELPVGAYIATSARDSTEYGFDVSLQSELYTINEFALILDTRYSISVTAKADERADHYGALLGIRYLIQKKLRSERPPIK